MDARIERSYQPSAKIAADAHVNAQTYAAMYETSIADSEGF